MASSEIIGEYAKASEIVFNRNGAEDIKRSLRSTKNIDPRTLRSLEKAVDKSLKAELKEGEDFAILYLDANNL